MLSAASLLAAYDEQLRTSAETTSALAVTRHGPLILVTFPGGRGFITYRHLDGLDADAVGRLVPEALTHYRDDPAIAEVEWKSRGHDHAPGLHEALLANGFVRGEPESIMIGEARLLAVDVALPAGVTLRRVTSETDIRAMITMQHEVFGGPGTVDDLMLQFAPHAETELWIAEADGRIVSTGRLEPVHGSTFAGIWGGATRPEWRGRGIYRALTAERARSALRMGKTLINSDSTEYSRPILERSGLLKVSTTTPYVWSRESALL